MGKFVDPLSHLTPGQQDRLAAGAPGRAALSARAEGARQDRISRRVNFIVWGIAGSLLLFLILFITLGWNRSVGGVPVQVAATHELTGGNDHPPAGAAYGFDYLTLKAEAEEKLDDVLTDDHGVRYQDVRTEITSSDGGKIVSFCGQENSRTPFGGYGGFQRFIASRSAALTESQALPAEFKQAWIDFCEDGQEGPQVWF